MNTPHDMITQASPGVEAIFLKNGRMLPMYDALTRDGDRLIFHPPHRDKETAIAMVRALFEAKDVVAYLFVDEAWALTTKDLSVLKRSSISDHPDRIEIVAFTAEAENSGMLCARRRIIRPVHGRAHLGPLEIDETFSANLHGRMTGLLPRRSGPLQ